MKQKVQKSPEEKLSIVLEGIKGEITITDLCIKHGISQAWYYAQRDKFLEGGKRALVQPSLINHSQAERAKIEELEKVIGRQTVEIQILKKLESHLSNTDMIDELKVQGHAVKNICQVLQINRSSYYRGRKQQEKHSVEQQMKNYEPVIKIIKQIKSDHPYWGYRRVRAYLRYRMGIRISYKLTYRLMKENGLLVDVKRYKATRVAQREKIRAEKVNQVWGTDMTKFYLDTVGWLYLVVVLDWFTKKIVGWDLSIRSKSEQWMDALNQAVEKELTHGSRDYNLMLISDNSSQPTSIKYENFCYTLGINHITTSYSNPKGNADTERFFRTFKEEIIWTRDYDKFDEAIKSVEDFIEFYNNDYPRSTLGYISPVDFEKQNIYSKVA